MAKIVTVDELKQLADAARNELFEQARLPTLWASTTLCVTLTGV